MKCVKVNHNISHSNMIFEYANAWAATHAYGHTPYCTGTRILIILARVILIYGIRILIFDIISHIHVCHLWYSHSDQLQLECENRIKYK